jgi:hypothetical membrane protein
MNRQLAKASDRIAVFTDKYPLIGPTFWIVCVQFFITMFLVALTWNPPYSILNNTISDLGNTACGVYMGRYVCSPWFSWMNASLIVLGATMVAGSTLIYQEFKKSKGSLIGFAGMALAGFGTILVGLFAENTIGSLHYIGALLPFFIGNLSMVILGFALDLPKWMKIYAITSGVISLIAFGLFATHHYLGLGIGGMERIVAHPQTLWLIIFGIYMSSTHYLGVKSQTNKPG